MWASRSATACRALDQDPEGECLWVRLYEDLDDLRNAGASFVETYNTQWLIHRHRHEIPREKYLASLSAEAA